MKTILQFLFGAALGAIGLAVTFAVMLRFNTAPATAFAYLLFFTAVQWIATASFRRELLARFCVGWGLCLASSFWVLRSSVPRIWEREDQFSPYSFAWRSIAVMVVLLATPLCAEYLAARSVKSLSKSPGAAAS